MCTFKDDLTVDAAKQVIAATLNDAKKMSAILGSVFEYTKEEDVS